MSVTTGSETQSLPPIVVLLDDERDILEMYSTYFQGEGVWVASAASAHEGLLAVEELRPDLIITDINFGAEPSGATFVETLKSRPDTCGIPLIVLTGLATTELAPHVRKDADLFLRKPVEPKALLLNVERLLESSHALRARSDRARARMTHLLVRSEDLLGRAKKLVASSPARAARCPQCLEPLRWSDTGTLDQREYEYYDWCQRGCGLYCFDTATGAAIRLA